ncbi:MAG: class I SAM-dependent methyltransferase [Planctomycetota bacterium]|nr:class I SAM-dependent methyltransferase [Planctomycetota bacterium]
MKATKLLPVRPEAAASRGGQEEARIVAAYARRRTSADAARYSCFDPANLASIQDRERRTLCLLERRGFRPLQTKRILEVGCGAGHWIRAFIQWGAAPENLTGVDLLPDRVAEAQRLCPSGVRLECGSAAELAFPDDAFDIVLQSTVFTSILDADLKQRVAQEMLRVVKPEGAILWYDFRVNNPRNPDVRGVRMSEIRRLFSGCQIQLKAITLAPPLARRLAVFSPLACDLLARIPWVCTHYVGLIRK